MCRYKYCFCTNIYYDIDKIFDHGIIVKCYSCNNGAHLQGFNFNQITLFSNINKYIVFYPECRKSICDLI